MLRLLFIILLVSISACSGSKKAGVKYQDIYDFSNIKQYSLYQRDHEFNDWQSLSHAQRNDIELAIERSLDQQGYQYTQPEQADVIIAYYMVGGELGSLKRYNDSVRYCSYCLVHHGSGERIDRLVILPGDLIIDVLDGKHQRSIWRAKYPLNIDPKDNSREVQVKIHEAISTMLKQINVAQSTPVSARK